MLTKGFRGWGSRIWPWFSVKLDQELIEGGESKFKVLLLSLGLSVAIFSYGLVVRFCRDVNLFSHFLLEVSIIWWDDDSCISFVDLFVQFYKRHELIRRPVSVILSKAVSFLYLSQKTKTREWTSDANATSSIIFGQVLLKTMIRFGFLTPKNLSSTFIKYR